MRWFKGVDQYHIIIYFEGPITKWSRQARDWQCLDHGNDVIEPLPDDDGRYMPKPDAREIVCQQALPVKRFALWWAAMRIRGMRNLHAEVWPL